MINMNKETINVVNESLGRIADLPEEMDTVAALNPVMAAAVVDSDKIAKRIDARMKPNIETADELVDYENEQTLDRCSLVLENLEGSDVENPAGVYDVQFDVYIDPESDGTAEDFGDVVDEFIVAKDEDEDTPDYPYVLIDVAVSDVDLADEYDVGENALRIYLTVESNEFASVKEFFNDVKDYINDEDSELPYEILNDFIEDESEEDITDELGTELAESLYKMVHSYKKKLNKNIISESLNKFTKLVQTRILHEGQHNFAFDNSNLIEVERALKDLLSSKGYLVDTEEGQNYIDGVVDLLAYSPDLGVKPPKEIALEWYIETKNNYPEDLAEFPKLSEAIEDEETIITPVVDPSEALVNNSIMESVDEGDLDLENNCYEFCLVAVEANGYTDHFYMSDCKSESDFARDEDAQIFVNSTCDVDDVVKVEVTRYHVGVPSASCTVLSTADAKELGDKLLDDYDPEVIEEYEFDVICEA